jgi:hypothetical protein
MGLFHFDFAADNLSFRLQELASATTKGFTEALCALVSPLMIVAKQLHLEDVASSWCAGYTPVRQAPHEY